MRNYLNIEISQLTGALLVFLPFGYLTGTLALAAVLAVSAYLTKHGFYLIRLAHLIHHDKPITPPYPADIWGMIYKELSRHRLRSRKRKRTLNRFSSRFRKVTNSIPDGLILLNKSGNIEWANPAADNLLHISWPRDENLSLLERIKHDDLADYLKNPDYSKPLEFPSPVNKAIIVSLRVTRFGGKKAQRLVVIRNITDVYTLNQTRRDFVSNVSHELRTPLTVITGFLENLGDNEMLPFQQRPFTLMSQQAERMNSIINDLLALSRLEMGEAPSSDKPIAVPELLSRIVDQARLLADQKGGYTINLQVDDQLCLLGEESELTSAFSNLIFNAIVHTPPGTVINISWESLDNQACLTVADSGPGIEQRHIPRLTERFYRADKARSRQSGGTGLGLAIVKHIIGRHDGELQIASQLGSGSQFKCLFPEDVILHKSNLKTLEGQRSDDLESAQDM
ncbi:MAG: phosphate regulon sensor histidine kinase PhoR [gamma proteobacterium symbiont of Stewartia floridana]|nr:phosphate regulon sensor histidine kinase PhoR [Candidatus Thiodiazotropha taylori]RLW52615.1 MAG: phosphate regulon sensor histidine kinase PhoR [gamma proteobacterium symbiont of Stewartia floridana]MCG7893853.1 phosphate regulon sensor histidine kinase PhoR [Candidatus Thiodiazotropha taylori]MCG7909879.1 phosphate regulon sensor histidine kinase PhoR [Candidatus Thiodiazotropha taylori]MCG7919182.1 phosphate regulon sensor histidine kinase PhoR [Candidatus Thiodiazotropha taylori]